MYRPELNPGETLIKTSPDVTVKNVLFDAILTNKRIIFVKKTDDLYDKKELVFPINLVRKFDPKADQAGTPTIEFSIQKPGGDLGSLILKFNQTGEYRYAERDDWVERLRRLTSQAGPAGSYEPKMQTQPAPSFTSQERPPSNNPFQFSPQNNQQNTGIFSGQPSAPPVSPGQQHHTVPPRDNPYAQSPQRPQAPPVQNPYENTQGYTQQGRPPVFPPNAERMPQQPAGARGMQMPPGHDPGFPQKSTFCRFCGASVPTGSVFCPSCGQKAEQAPPAQQPQGMQQRPPAPPVHPGMPPSGSQYGQRPANPPYGAAPGGISLADDPEYLNMQKRGRRAPPLQKNPNSPPGFMDKKQQKAYEKAENQRIKDEKAALKAKQKAMKKRQKEDYDPYGYRESRMPDGLPKIIGGVVAVIVIIAVAFYAVNSGMLFSSGTTPSGSQSQPTVQNTQGSTTVSSNYGVWNYQIFYKEGKWSGYCTVNGEKTQITNEDGDTEIEGSIDPQKITNPSGTIIISATKVDRGTGTLEIVLFDPKGKEIAVEKAEGSSETATLTKTF